MELTKTHGHVYFIINEAEYEETKKYLNKFLTVTYHMAGQVVRTYDLKPHEITGNHENIQVDTNAFSTKTNQSSDVLFEDFLLNNDWIQMAITARASDLEIKEILQSLSMDFIQSIENANDPIMESEYLAVITGHNNLFQKVFDKIRQLRDQEK